MLGGAIYATYSVFTNSAISKAISRLELNLNDRFSKLELQVSGKLSELEQKIAVNYERHLTLLGSVATLQARIEELSREIDSLSRDGRKVI